MKNNFVVKVSFKDVPNYPYEWDNMAIISGIKVIRVKTSVIKDLLCFDARLVLDNQIVILSDCKTSIVLRIDKSGKVVKRSFLTFSEDEDICEYASSLKCTNLDYEVLGSKLNYLCKLDEEVRMKEYVVKLLNEIKDENEYKYLYYLFFDKIDDYKKEKLLDFIKKDKPGNFQKLYDFLITK